MGMVATFSNLCRRYSFCSERRARIFALEVGGGLEFGLEFDDCGVPAVDPELELKEGFRGGRDQLVAQMSSPSYARDVFEVALHGLDFDVQGRPVVEVLNIASDKPDCLRSSDEWYHVAVEHNQFSMSFRRVNIDIAASGSTDGGGISEAPLPGAAPPTSYYRNAMGFMDLVPFGMKAWPRKITELQGDAMKFKQWSAELVREQREFVITVAPIVVVGFGARALHALQYGLGEPLLMSQCKRSARFDEPRLVHLDRRLDMAVIPSDHHGVLKHTHAPNSKFWVKSVVPARLAVIFKAMAPRLRQTFPGAVAAAALELICGALGSKAMDALDDASLRALAVEFGFEELGARSRHAKPKMSEHYGDRLAGVGVGISMGCLRDSRSRSRRSTGRNRSTWSSGRVPPAKCRTPRETPS